MVTTQCDQPRAEAIRIVLDDDESKKLLEAGTFFAVIQRGQYPQHHGGQMVLHIIPVDYTTAVAAVEVAQGKRRTIKANPPSNERNIPHSRLHT